MIERAARLVSRFNVPVLAMGLVLSLSCGGGEGELRVAREPGKILAVCTTTHLADLVRQVGGPRVQVVSLMEPTDDPHRYRLPGTERGLLAEADIIFMNGLQLEEGLENDLKKAGRRRQLVDIGQSIHPTFIRRPPDLAGRPDPHIWGGMQLWVRAAWAVQTALSRADSLHEEEYWGRAELFKTRLGELSAWALETLQKIPEEKKVIVTAHDALAYFGESVGIETLSLQGISTTSDYKREDVEELADELARRGIEVVFAEAGGSPEPLEELLEAAREGGHELRRGGTLFTDALGEPGTPADNYLGMFRHNVATIARALE